jgi:hypothetical protein
MNSITHTVKIVSACKTYSESVKCFSIDEANAIAEASRQEGSNATIKAVKKAK